MLRENFLWQGGEAHSSAVEDKCSAVEDKCSAVAELAHDIYNSAPVPNAKDEEWKFTSLDKFIDGEISPSPAITLNKESTEITDTAGLAKLIFVNGYFNEELSSVPDSVTISTIEFDSAESASADSYKTFFARLPLAALSVQCSHKALDIRIADGADLHMQIIFVGSNQGKMTHHGHFIRLSVGANAQVELFEKHISADKQCAYMHHDFLRLEISESAKLHHYKLQLVSAGVVHLGHADVHLQGKSHYDYRLLQLGGNLARQDLHVHLLQAGGKADVQALLLPTQKQVNHLSTDLRHIDKDCESNQRVKMIAAGGGISNYQGRVHIAEGAIGSVGHQHSRGLLLDKDSEINNKPELEIFADAVECAHGSAVGELEEEPLFYLKSRGIEEVKAYGLLLQAYVGEVAETFANCRSFIEVQFCLSQRMQELADILKTKGTA